MCVATTRTTTSLVDRLSEFGFVFIVNVVRRDEVCDITAS